MVEDQAGGEGAAGAGVDRRGATLVCWPGGNGGGWGSMSRPAERARPATAGTAPTMRQGTCRRSREGLRRSCRTRSPWRRRSHRRRSRMTWIPRMARKALWIFGNRKERSEGTTAYRVPTVKKRCAQRGQMPWETWSSSPSPSVVVVPHHAQTVRMVAHPIISLPVSPSPLCPISGLRLAVQGLLCYPGGGLMIVRTFAPPVRHLPKEPGMPDSAAGAPPCRARRPFLPATPVPPSHRRQRPTPGRV